VSDSIIVTIPAFRKAREILDSGVMGDLMFIRARYGHGGRVGYDQEWRADPKLSGGGELIDQGIHLIDLAGWFLAASPRSTARRQPFSGTCRWTTTLFEFAHGQGPDGVAARQLHGMEESFLV